MNIKTLFLLSFFILASAVSIVNTAANHVHTEACRGACPTPSASSILTSTISDLIPSDQLAHAQAPVQPNTPSLTDNIKNNILLLAMNSVWQDFYTTIKSKIWPIKPDHVTRLTQNLHASNAHLTLLVAERTRLEDKLKNSDLTAADKDHVKKELASTEDQITTTKKLQAQVLEAHTAQVLKGLGKHVHGAGCNHHHEHGHSHA